MYVTGRAGVAWKGVTLTECHTAWVCAKHRCASLCTGNKIAKLNPTMRKINRMFETGSALMHATSAAAAVTVQAASDSLAHVAIICRHKQAVPGGVHRDRLQGQEGRRPGDRSVWLSLCRCVAACCCVAVTLLLAVSLCRRVAVLLCAALCVAVLLCLCCAMPTLVRPEAMLIVGGRWCGTKPSTCPAPTWRGTRCLHEMSCAI